MNAIIGNEMFVAGQCIFSGTNSGGFIFETIVASASDDTLSINITIEENIQVKGYDFVIDNVTARYNSNTFSSNIFKNQYTSESGRLMISKVDSVNNRVEGTFNFKAKNFLAQEVIISNGGFKAIIN